MARRGVDYNAGASAAIGQQYADLMKALQAEGEARNRREAEDIQKRGMLGTGIQSSDIQDLSRMGMAFAEWGDKRKARQMQDATSSFERQRRENLGRIDELRRFGDRESIAEIKAIQAGMMEERGKYENLLGDYRSKSLWDTGFGGEGVGYKSTGDPSSYTKSLLESEKKREEERERQARILSDESRRQQGQTSYYGLAPAEVPADPATRGRSFDPEDPLAYAPGGGGSLPPGGDGRRDVRDVLPEPQLAAGVVEGLSREQQEGYEDAAFGTARKEWEEDTARDNRRKKIEDEAEIVKAVMEPVPLTNKELAEKKAKEDALKNVPSRWRELVEYGKKQLSQKIDPPPVNSSAVNSSTAEQFRKAIGNYESPSKHPLSAGGPGAGLGLAEQQLLSAQPGPLKQTAHEKRGLKRFYKGMSFGELDDAMRDLPTYTGSLENAHKQALANNKDWFIHQGKPYSVTK